MFYVALFEAKEFTKEEVEIYHPRYPFDARTQKISIFGKFQTLEEAQTAVRDITAESGKVKICLIRESYIERDIELKKDPEFDWECFDFDYDPPLVEKWRWTEIGADSKESTWSEFSNDMFYSYEAYFLKDFDEESLQKILDDEMSKDLQSRES